MPEPSARRVYAIVQGGSWTVMDAETKQTLRTGIARAKTLVNELNNNAWQLVNRHSMLNHWVAKLKH